MLICGFAFAGATSKTFLIRNGGPFMALAPFNLSGTLAQTSIILSDGAGKSIATNTG